MFTLGGYQTMQVIVLSRNRNCIVHCFFFVGPLEAPVPHVPDPSTFEGMHTLFSLCNIVEMANILHPESYDTGLRASHRLEMIRGRFLSRAIVSWVISNYEIEHVSMEAFYWSYLAYQARAICYAKKFGDSREAYSYTGIPLAGEVQALIEHSFYGITSFWETWEFFAGVEPDTFAWPNDDPILVKIRNPRVQGMSAAYLKINLCIFMPASAQLEWNADGRNFNDIQWASDQTDRAERPRKRGRLA